MAGSFYSKQQMSGARTTQEAGRGRVSNVQDAHHLRTRQQLAHGAWSMEIPAGPPVSGACEWASPARERSAKPEYHIPVFSNSELGQQLQEQQPSWPAPTMYMV